MSGMFGSLRFRLPALFFAGIVLAGVVATTIAYTLFQDYLRDRALAELRRESFGVTRLYASEAESNAPVRARRIEQATGDHIFYIERQRGIGIDIGTRSLRRLPRSILDIEALERQELVEFEFVAPGEDRTYLGVARPLKVGREGLYFGAIVVARPETELQQSLRPLVRRLGLAFLGGILVAAGLAVYFTRRITRPVIALSQVADEVATGRYDVRVPKVRGRGEIRDLADRFGEMAEQLAEADQRERSFFMSVSHELRTPLTAIRGHVDALREGVAEDPEAREDSLDVIASETARLERLVGDVLDLAKLEAHRFTLLHEEVDMGRLCEQAYSAFNEEARRRSIQYRQQFSAKPVILSDGDRVLQIISNLLSNAFRWTPDGGRIELALGSANGSVAVEVGDSGPGISPEMLDRIFRPFVSEDGGGTGLGLAIARELANALGGQIEVESEPGAGSRFKLLLPLTSETVTN
jgi:signal transduction histidine kinase